MSSSSSLDEMCDMITKMNASFDKACEVAYNTMIENHYYLKSYFVGVWNKRGMALYFDQEERFIVSKGYKGDVLLLESIMYSPEAKKVLLCWAIDYMAGKRDEDSY